MFSIECPWCTAPAVVDLTDAPGMRGMRDRGLIAPDPITEPIARAA